MEEALQCIFSLLTSKSFCKISKLVLMFKYLCNLVLSLIKGGGSEKACQKNYIAKRDYGL